ncbi:MBL fold metallo-hydrolase [Botrimarina sp.]|uniref:MBL fold metallo-hydrolase n=1 Tax=Botrimarina sp. TaxID=2795802 RepID=UPI0032ECC095
MKQLGRWRLDTLSGGDFSIDGGAVYGVVPKTVWSKLAPPDELNRVRMRNNCVLLRDGDQTVLIDTGYGGKYAPLDRAAYAMQEGTPIVDSLNGAGVAPQDVDVVLLSHLHFDHAGGVTSRGPNGQLHLTFPNARHVVGRFEWEDATSRRPELLAAYPQDNLTPLEGSGRLELVDDGSEVATGIHVIRTGGHTRGHLAVRIDGGGQTALFIGDLVPTTEHVRPNWGLAYDTFPLVTRRRKQQLLGEAADGGWLVVWSHDRNTAVSRLARRGANRFVVEQCERHA